MENKLDDHTTDGVALIYYNISRNRMHVHKFEELEKQNDVQLEKRS
jgi:hypothetical protein